MDERQTMKEPFDQKKFTFIAWIIIGITFICISYFCLSGLFYATVLHRPEEVREITDKTWKKDKNYFISDKGEKIEIKEMNKKQSDEIMKLATGGKADR